MSSSVIRAPFSASASAMASPRPLPAPVTMAPRPATLNNSETFTYVLTAAPAAAVPLPPLPAHVHADLHALLTAQALEPLLDHAIEGDRLDPTCERIAAPRHLGNHRRKGIYRQCDTREAHLRHQEVERRDDERLGVDRHHDRGPIDAGAVQHRGKGLRDPRRIDGGMRTAASGEIAN